jgi:hypothetical protein
VEPLGQHPDRAVDHNPRVERMLQVVDGSLQLADLSFLRVGVESQPHTLGDSHRGCGRTIG